MIWSMQRALRWRLRRSLLRVEQIAAIAQLLLALLLLILLRVLLLLLRSDRRQPVLLLPSLAPRHGHRWGGKGRETHLIRGWREALTRRGRGRISILVAHRWRVQRTAGHVVLLLGIRRRHGAAGAEGVGGIWRWLPITHGLVGCDTARGAS